MVRMKKNKYKALEPKYKNKKPEEIATEDLPEYIDWQDNYIHNMEYVISKSDTKPNVIKNMKRKISRIQEYIHQAEIEAGIVNEPNRDDAELIRQEEAEQAAQQTDTGSIEIPAHGYSDLADDISEIKYQQMQGQAVRKRKFHTREKDGHIEAQAVEGIEKYAENIISEEEIRQMLEQDVKAYRAREKMAEILHSNEDRFKGTTFHVVFNSKTDEKADFDYDNMKKYITMGISGYVVPSSAKITFNEQGEGLVYGNNKGNKIVFASIDAEHNVSFVPDEKIELQQAGIPYEGIDHFLPKDKDEPLYSGPKAVDAFILVKNEDGSYFRTLDKNGDPYKGSNAYYDIDSASVRAKNIMNSIQQISQESGIALEDLRIVDDCSYVMTKDGRAVGILGPAGDVIENIQQIEHQQDIGQEVPQEQSGKTENNGDIENEEKPKTVKVDGEEIELW